MAKEPLLSIIVPLYNEEENVEALFTEIRAVCSANGYTHEIIFVDDGSSDATVKRALCLKPLTLVRLRRNFGQTAAMDAGIKQATGRYIVTMDGDRQNDPTDIPHLLSYLEDNNLDVVSGWRKNRRDSLAKRFVSRVANVLRKLIVNDHIHDSGCSLKIYRRECFTGVDLFGEMHRFIPAVLMIQGFRIGEIVVNHRPRTAGKTKYSWSRTVKGFIDMIAVWFWKKFAVRPLHLLGGLGMGSILLGMVSGGYTVYLFFRGKSLSDTVFPLLTAFLLITGVQLFIFGLLADMLAKNYYEKNRSAYSIAGITVNRASGTRRKQK